MAHNRIHWRVLVSLSLVALGVLTRCPFGSAQRTPAQYSVTSWGHKDGLPSTFLYAIAQTGDGFLWLGTADGLVRFDGVQFTPWHPALPAGQPLGQVRALVAARDGSLLIGTGTGLFGRMRNGNLQTAQLYSPVESIQESQDGSLWVATSTDLWHLEDASLQPRQSPIAMPAGWLSGPLQDSDGTEWITTQAGIFSVDGHRLVRRKDQGAWLFHNQDGHLAWLDQRGDIHSLQQSDSQRRANVPQPSSLTIAQVTADRSGCVWIATQGNGVLRLATTGGHTATEHFTRDDGLSSNFVRAIFQDREQNLWVATENGLNRLRRNDVLLLTRQNGLLSDTVTSIAAGNDGSLWLATPDGLERLRNEQPATYRGVRVLSLLMSLDQQLWAGSARGLLRWDNGRLVASKEDAEFAAVTTLTQGAAGTLWFYDAEKGLFRQQSGHAPTTVTNLFLRHQAVTAMVAVTDNEMWFGLAGGNIVAYRQGAFHTYSQADGLPGGAIHGLATGRTGELWAATERGLCLFTTGTRFTCWNAQSGLPGDRVLWALPDRKGNLWLGYNIGVAQINIQQLRATVSPAGGPFHGKLFDDGDGIENSPSLRGNSPAVFAPDGRLWLTTTRGVAILDPAHLRTNLLPPPVRILGLEADGQTINLAQPVRLRPLTRSLQFSFTALSLSDPRKVRFRYRLDGFDRQWHDGGGRRDAFYTNLPPGRYFFRVRAANNDGVWNDAGATLPFVLAPAYYQTVWFRLVFLGAVLLGGALVFRSRLRVAKRIMRMRYEERMEERTRIAQELHDHLIQEMMGISMQLEVADELTPSGERAKRPLQRALSLARSAIANGRLTLQSLRSRPISASTLMDTLRQTAESYPKKEGVSVHYIVEGEERLLHPEIAEDLSEIGQEALRNALKHAGGADISVLLRYSPSSLELRVQDHGGGIADTLLHTGIPGHFGLAGMRERAARIAAVMTIDSRSCQGTTVHVSVPASRAWQEEAASKASYLSRLFRTARQEKAK